MIKKKGKTISGGIALGRIAVYRKTKKEVKKIRVNDPLAEWERYKEAKKEALLQLEKLYEQALQEVGEDEAEIFRVHAMMLEDEDYNDSVRELIHADGSNAEYAVSSAGEHFAALFSGMEDEYMQARSSDVRDISDRLIRILTAAGEDFREAEPKEAYILLAEDLSPSETLQLNKKKLLAFVTTNGSANSHTAILARTMGIPALIGIEADMSDTGKLAVVDGDTGTLLLEPDEETLQWAKDKLAGAEEERRILQSLKGKENVTRSGQKIEIMANIGSVEELADVLECDAGGIGLFRSEFLYLEAADYPTEEEQFAVYRKVAEAMGGRKAIIRTLDIGADKQADYFRLEKEENPALGLRAIRICLKYPEIFKTQLRALYRASAYGNLAIMYPMIISLDEVRKIKEISAAVRKELQEEGMAIGQPEEGIMVETPAAALLSAELAREVDFFSIGTNDLTQYTLAMDRQNASLEPFYDPHHPAVLELIRQVIDHAHAAGIWAGICGELGADISLTGTFLKMGVDELSVSPASVLRVRRAVREAE